jgi:hypothetical protein
MTLETLESIRSWDKRCGDNEATFFPVAIDRRRLLEYVDELRAELAACVSRRDQHAAGASNSSDADPQRYPTQGS